MTSEQIEEIIKGANPKEMADLFAKLLKAKGTVTSEETADEEPEPSDGNEQEIELLEVEVPKKKRKNKVNLIEDIGQAGERQALRKPIEIGKKRKNKFVDSKGYCAAEAEWDKRVVRDTSLSHMPKRPGFQKVEVTCSSCNRDYIVPISFLPEKIDAGDSSNYRCTKCSSGR